jgi:hypothetical protein
MHKYFKELMTEMATYHGRTEEDLIQSLESTVEHAARKHLHLYRDAQIQASVDAQSGELKVLHAGEEVPKKDLGQIHTENTNFED